VATVLWLPFTLLLGTTPALAQPGQPVQFTDDFQKDSLGDYQTVGKVAWQNGQVKLPAGAQLIRRLRAGYTVEARATLRLAKGEARRVANLKINGDRGGPGALLMSVEDGTLLSIPAAGKRLLLHERKAGEAAAEENWEVRLRVRHGLARLKVWKDGAAEPKDWLAVFYLGHPAWQPQAVSVFGGNSGGCVLTRLRITADRPPEALDPARLKKSLQARDLLQGAAADFEKGDFPTAARKAIAAVALVKEAHGETDLATALALQNTGAFLQAMGERAAARSYVEQSLTVKRKLFDPDHPSTALGLNALGAILSELGDPAAARPLLEQGLDIRRKVLGPRHPDTAVSMSNLGGALIGLGDLLPARALLEEALAVQEAALGPNHPAVAQALNNLAVLLSDLGETGPARKHYEKALALLRESRGDKHPATIMARANLGGFLGKAGELEAGHKQLEKALALARAKFGSEQPATAHILTLLGHVLTLAGEYPAARKALEEALAVRRRKLGPDHPETASTLEALGDLEFDLEDRTAARRFYEQALAARDRKGKDSLALAGDLNRLGRLAVAEGDLVRARPYVERALTIHRSRRGPEHPETAAAQVRLADLLGKLGEHSAAQKLYEEALAVQKKKLGADHPEVIAALGGLGGVYQDCGELATARKLYEQALALARKRHGTDHPRTAGALNDLGSLFRAAGDYAAARPYFEKALALRQQELGPKHPQTAVGLGQMAGVMHQLGDLGEARKLYERALEIQRARLGPEHPHTLVTLSNLGTLFGELGEHARARKCYEEVLRADERKLGPDHPQSATTLANLALSLTQLGEAARARELLDRALKIRRDKLGEDHPSTALSWYALGCHLARQGDLDGARAHCAKALTLLEKKLGDWHPHRGRVLDAVAVLEAAAGNPAAAWSAARQAAAVQARVSDQLLAASAEREHSAIVAGWRISYDQLHSLAAADPKTPEERARQLLAAVFDWKGMSGRAVAARREALLLSGADDAAALYEELKLVRARLVRALMHGGGAKSAPKPAESLEALGKRRGELERALAERVGAYAVLQQARQAGPERAAARLASGEVLVELVKYRHYEFDARAVTSAKMTVRYSALLLWRAAGKSAAARVRLVPLGPAEPLDRAVHAWRTSVQAGRVEEQAERAVRERIWAPLARALPGTATRLILAPDSELALLPFEAIRLEDGKYLVERYAVSYVSSGRDLLPRPQPREKSTEALIVADPDYDAVPGPGTAPAGRPPGGGLRFRSLPGFAHEGEAAAKALRGRPDWRVRVLRGADATEERLANGKRPRLLYCITHGFFLKDLEAPRRSGGLLRDLELVDPSPAQARFPALGTAPQLRSGLALAGANRWHERSQRGLSDGLLTALEVEDLDLWGTELVFLSACETGLGEVQVGEGVLGLRRAFQLAGARTVVASLWKVPDAETERLMSTFLSRWLKGAGKAEALRQAQLEMIRALRASPLAVRRQAPPLYWAAFVCHGDPR
jgi:tetratricopeptide (TPR) repeat protein